MNVMLKLGIFSICHKCRCVNLGFNTHVAASVTFFSTTELQYGCKNSALRILGFDSCSCHRTSKSTINAFWM
jgi:hypothetical protein